MLVRYVAEGKIFRPFPPPQFLFFIHFLTAWWLACELRNEDEAKTTLNHFSAQPKQMGNITIRVPATSAISQERPCKCNSRSRTNHKSWETVAPMACEFSSPSNLWRFCASAQRFFIFPPSTSFFSSNGNAREGVWEFPEWVWRHQAQIRASRKALMR